MSVIHVVSLGVVATVFTVTCAAGGPPDPDAGSGAPQAGWISYSDATEGFELEYPPELGILPEPKPQADGALKRVRFQDKHLMTTQFAELEPPRFVVEIFPLKAGMSLPEWLRANNRLPGGAATVEVKAAPGASEGLRVDLRQQLAPNQFFYFAGKDRVYKLTPLGQFSSQMMASFRLP